MSEDGAVTWTPDAADRIADAVRTIEGGGTIRQPDRGASGFPPGDRIIAVRVTSSVDTDGNYSAVPTSKVSGAWTDSVVTVKTQALNGEPLKLSKRYAALPGGTTLGGDQLWLAIPTCCGFDDPPPPDDAACFCATSDVFCVTVAGVTRAADFECNLFDFNQFCASINRTFTLRYQSSSLEPGGGLTCFWADISNAHVRATLQITSTGDAQLFLAVARGSGGEGPDITVTYHLAPFVCDGSNVLVYGGGEPGSCCENWPATLTVGACGGSGSGGCACEGTGTLYTEFPSVDYGGGDVTSPQNVELSAGGGCTWFWDGGAQTITLDLSGDPATMILADGRGGSATYTVAQPVACDSQVMTFDSQTGGGTWPGTISYGVVP